ncbi:MAG: PEP-CTERM sorting domain-containing protein, partial [Desulfobacula sp.]|nr:PEP-CTERM sorting domain-containing protein [Desulfobacula sp.]
QGFFDYESDPWMGTGGNPADYLFYDDIHPTTDAHWLLAQYATSAVPIPGALLLFCSGLIGLAGLRRRKAA